MKTKILADFKSALCTLILESKFGDNPYQVYFNHVRHVFILVQFCTVNEGKLRNICAHYHVKYMRSYVMYSLQRKHFEISTKNVLAV